MSTKQIVIVGAGHAGGSAAAFLRQFGWDGGIILVGNEDALPYHRPPLSKAFLAGGAQIDDIHLRPKAFYQTNGIDLTLGASARSIDRDARTVRLSDGRNVPYEYLFLATGARQRQLTAPGMGLQGVTSLRTVADAQNIRMLLGNAANVVVVGAGYIGLEVASSARKLGRSVTVVERDARVLGRVASPILSTFAMDYHRKLGVDFRLNVSVEEFQGRTEKVESILLTDGSVLQCDVAIVGIGIGAEDELARISGVACGNGIRVDHNARTSDPFIYALGDCTSRTVGESGQEIRLECVQNAVEQAKQAAAHVCGRPNVRSEVPSTWSDQFDLRLQLAGFTRLDAKFVVRGDQSAGSFSIFQIGVHSTIEAVEAVNAAADFAFGKMMIASDYVVDTEKLQDANIPLKGAIVSR